MPILVNDFLRPVDTPEKYAALSDVVAWKATSEGQVIIEIFKRANGTFGYRFNAWVAWRDADDEVRSHDWLQINPQNNLITDTIEKACLYAEKEALRHDLSVSVNWQHPI